MAINFDEAQRQWRRNKIDMGGGIFEYCCGYLKPNGDFCKAPPRHWAMVLRPKYQFHSYPRTPGPCKYHFNLSSNFN